MSSTLQFEEENDLGRSSSRYVAGAGVGNTNSAATSAGFSKAGFTGPSAPIIYSRFQRSNDIPTIVRVVMKTRVVKNEKQAQIFLLGLVFVLICVALFMARGVIFPHEMKELPFVNIK